MVPYGGDPALVLRHAVEMEVQGKDFYERAAGRMKNQRGKDMFKSLSRQEVVHIDVLEDQLNRFIHDKVWSSLKELKKEAEEHPQKSVFDDSHIKNIKLDPAAGELDVIRLGMEVEKKSVEYYGEAGRESADSKAKELFNWLVAQETGHLQILQAEFDYRTKSGFYYDTAEFSLETE